MLSSLLFSVGARDLPTVQTLSSDNPDGRVHRLYCHPPPRFPRPSPTAANRCQNSPTSPNSRTTMPGSNVPFGLPIYSWPRPCLAARRISQHPPARTCLYPTHVNVAPLAPSSTRASTINIAWVPNSSVYVSSASEKVPSFAALVIRATKSLKIRKPFIDITKVKVSVIIIRDVVAGLNIDDCCGDEEDESSAVHAAFNHSASVAGAQYGLLTTRLGDMTAASVERQMNLSHRYHAFTGLVDRLAPLSSGQAAAAAPSPASVAVEQGQSLVELAKTRAAVEEHTRTVLRVFWSPFGGAAPSLARIDNCRTA
ncbi:hypothetical protein CALVIDRAFT_47000 [Calocera viscosa TUFC12733]|uniref:Uncharacterized protein n=1 Tax=Calocera viscosa (strain TUFC12733) TaxID=1330018 RepID=A0A167FKK1_CALVF|nr:hypothetical protein CALVIDRAFT_47000 [Calocera viscosa TUFC12733]